MKISITRKETKEALRFILEIFIETHEEENLYDEELKIAKKIIKKQMNTRQQFKRVFIEALHGLPYEEAIYKEVAVSASNWYQGGTTITIGRVLQVLSKFVNKKNINIFLRENKINIYARFSKDWDKELTLKQLEKKLEDSKSKFTYIIDILWELTKKDGVTNATDDDQSEETLIKLTNLLTY